MTHTALIDWYDTPRWYDMVFDPGTPTEADFVMQLAERYGRGPLRSVLEPACGSGRMVVELARRGVRVEGFDLNTHMLAAAQAKLDRLAARGILQTRKGFRRAAPVRETGAFVMRDHQPDTGVG